MPASSTKHSYGGLDMMSRATRLSASGNKHQLNMWVLFLTGLPVFKKTLWKTAPKTLDPTFRNMLSQLMNFQGAVESSS
jgi:hypothetical protein